MGIGEPGIDEWEEMVPVNGISFSGDAVDYVTDDEGSEYSFAEGDLKAVVSYSGLNDRNGVEMFEGDVFASVVYDTNKLSTSTLRWEIFYNVGKIQFYARERTENLLRPLYEFKTSGIQYKVIGSVLQKPHLVKA